MYDILLSFVWVIFMGKIYGIVRKIYIPVSSAHDLISSKKMYFIIDINNRIILANKSINLKDSTLKDSTIKKSTLKKFLYKFK